MSDSSSFNARCLSESHTATKKTDCPGFSSLTGFANGLSELISESIPLSDSTEAGHGMRGGPPPAAEDSVRQTYEVLLDCARELSGGLHPVKVSEMTGENPSPKDLQDSQFAAAHVALMNAKTLSILTQVATQAKKGIAVAPWPGGGNGGGGGPWRGCSRER